MPGGADEGSSIDRPRAAFKVLVCQDAGGTWLSNVDFRWFAKRYGAGPEEVRLITDMAVMIDGIARKAGSPP